MNELPIYRIVVNEDDETGVEFVSLVEKPAIKKDFLMFNEQRMTYAVQVWQYQVTTKSNYKLMSLRIKLEFDKDPASFNN